MRPARIAGVASAGQGSEEVAVDIGEADVENGVELKILEVLSLPHMLSSSAGPHERQHVNVPVQCSARVVYNTY